LKNYFKKKNNIISKERKHALEHFPWHHSLIFHEAGVPPIHTPIQTLTQLPASVKERLYVMHVAATNFPFDQGLKIAKEGVENTIRVPVQPPPHSSSLEILEAVLQVDHFRKLGIEKAPEILQTAKMENYRKGAVLIARGKVGEKFFILIEGLVSVWLDKENDKAPIKYCTTGEYFGETALLRNALTSATLIAETNVRCVVFNHYDFLYLIRGTNIAHNMLHLAQIREHDSWECMKENSILLDLSGSQKTSLQILMHRKELKKGEYIWISDSDSESAILVEKGSVELQTEDNEKILLGRGSWIGEINQMVKGKKHRTQCVAAEDCSFFEMEKDKLINFFESNPGIYLYFLKQTVISAADDSF